MNLQRLGEDLQRFGSALPGAWEDHPWGETVLKVKTKVFVFLGRPGPVLTLSVKLPDSGEAVLDQDWAEPTGYGLGKSGWVTLKLERGDEVDAARIRGWIEESYRAVAPKTLVRELDGGKKPAAPAKRAAPKRPAKKAARRKA